MLFNYISLELNAVTEQLLLVHFLTGENAAPKWFAQNYMINRWWDESRRFPSGVACLSSPLRWGCGALFRQVRGVRLLP